jgi:pimeloyl-ACP methyl ester carboxylesterase
MGQMQHWEPVLELMADSCRPIAPALPIFDPRLPEASIPALARHVVRFLAALDLSRVVIGGNSLGGHVALEVALSYLERVSGLILTGSSGLFERSFTRRVPHQPTVQYVRSKMEEVFYRRELVTPEWVDSVREIIHGGVSFGPYAAVFDEWMGRHLDRIEVYPASEGFVAVQTEPSDGLTLMLDYDIFYEFIPVEDLGSPRPRRHTVADVETGRQYAVVLTTAAGLWSYLLGDTVRFTARDPLRLVIAGRARHFVNAFGENVIVEEVERALLGACRRTEAEVAEFTVAPATRRLRSRGAPTTGSSSSGCRPPSRQSSSACWTRHSARSTPTTAPS